MFITLCILFLLVCLFDIFKSFARAFICLFVVITVVCTSRSSKKMSIFLLDLFVLSQIKIGHVYIVCIIVCLNINN